MFHIKICGVRLKSDIDAAADASADAIGLNFFPSSVRYVDPDITETRELSDHAASRGILRAGVFVNESPNRISQIAGQIGLDLAQLHGDETLQVAEDIMASGLPVLRAIKLPTGQVTTEELVSAIRPWQIAGAKILLDADAGSAHGGSGKTLDWNSIRQWSIRSGSDDWVLAGGLNPENVAVAIRQSGAARIDVASGVEETRGEKSANLISTFCARAIEEFSIER